MKSSRRIAAKNAADAAPRALNAEYVMKVRLRFSKTGALVYIGHLDVMRYFQKLFRRADIPVKYSEGFSPHQILSFTPPLPLGMESFGEYADVELIDAISSEDALKSYLVLNYKKYRYHHLNSSPKNAKMPWLRLRLQDTR